MYLISQFIKCAFLHLNSLIMFKENYVALILYYHKKLVNNTFIFIDIYLLFYYKLGVIEIQYSSLIG